MAAETRQSESSGSPLKELCGRGWERLDPSTDEQAESEKRVIGNYKGEPISVGFRTEEVAFVEGELIHEVYRTGQYDVHLKIENVSDGLAEGQIKVERAEGYENGGDNDD